MILSHLDDIALVAEKKECDGAKIAFGNNDVHSLKECAMGCQMIEASMFIFGTNDFGSTGCNEDGNKGCRCYCETSSTQGECQQKDNNDYRLYKLIQEGNNQKIELSLIFCSSFHM